MFLVRNSKKIFKLGFGNLTTQTCGLVQVSSNKIGIIGVPFDKGQEKIGVGLGPDVIREHDLINVLKSISKKIDIKDFGNIKYEPMDFGDEKVENMKKLQHFVACTKILSEQVQKVISEKRKCITLGGDHSIAVGSIDGHIKVNPNIGIIWVDAHADINTSGTSPSGNIHGMPVALLMKELLNEWPGIPGMDWQTPALLANSIAYIGIRDVDPLESMFLKNNHITAYGMREIETLGINNVIQRALETIDPNNEKSLHISFDIDGLDIEEAPSTGTPVCGGLTLREGMYIMEEVEKTGRLTAIDLVEVNPEIGNIKDVNKTVRAAIQLLKAGCGSKRIGNILGSSYNNSLQN